MQPHAWGACRPGRRKLRSALSPAFLHGTNPVGASLLASSLRWLKSSRDKLAPTGAIATSCMGCLPAWAEKAAICLVSGISARYKPRRSELARELFAAWLKSSRDKLAPTGAIAVLCMGCLPAWAEKAAICLVSRISARHKPRRNELARELFAVVEKLARQARSYRCNCNLLHGVPAGLDGESCDLPCLRHFCTVQTP